jgi:shikimate dehydrogenase
MNGYPTLSGRTLVVPILGDPIAQVRSPDGLTRTLAARGCDAVVVPLHVVADDFDALVRGVSRSPSVAGLIATVPHKFALAAHCGTLSDRARFLGSANVARRGTDGTWHGDQLDGAAFVAAVRAAGGVPQGARVLQVGVGGAGSAIALALLEAGAARLALHDADGGRLDGLLGRLGEHFGDRVERGSADPHGFDLVVNATPMGMRPDDPFPVDIARLGRGTFVGDVVTTPAIPPLIAAARRLGCRTSTGGAMFDAVAGLLADFLLAEGPLAGRA